MNEMCRPWVALLLCFAAGSFKQALTGVEIETIAERMRNAAERVTERAKSRVGPEEIGPD